MTKVDRVKALVLERIRCGEYPVGAMLPSLRGLADELHANVNTVAQAYRELAERGTVRSERGRGTFVLSAPDPTLATTVSDTLRDELAHLALRALEAGVGPKAFVRLAEEASAAQLARDPLRVFFVECNPFDTSEVAEHITRLLQLRVEPLLVDELQAHPEMFTASADLFITTPFHIDEVEAVVNEGAHVVHVTPTVRSLIELSRIPSGMRVVVVGSNERTVEQLTHLVKMHARLEPARALLIHAPDLTEALSNADMIVDSQAVHGRVNGLAAGTSCVTVHFQLEANSAEFLRARVHDLFPGLAKETARPV